MGNRPARETKKVTVDEINGLIELSQPDDRATREMDPAQFRALLRSERVAAEPVPVPAKPIPVAAPRVPTPVEPWVALAMTPTEPAPAGNMVWVIALFVIAVAMAIAVVLLK